MIPKIADRHLSRQACIYIRQSTLAQVRFNQESTERTDDKVLDRDLEQIRVLERAPGTRTDFKTLVGDVAMGHVGRSSLWRRQGWRARTRTGIRYAGAEPAARSALDRASWSIPRQILIRPNAEFRLRALA